MKLPVFRTVGEAYGFVWRERRLFWSLAVPGIIVLSIMNAISTWYLWIETGQPMSFAEYLRHAMSQSQSGFSATYWLLALVAMLIYFAVLVLYSVAWHRAYLLPDAMLTAVSSYRWQLRQTRFFLNYVKIFLILIPVFFVLLIGVTGITIAMGIAAGGEVSTASLIAWAFLGQAIVWLGLVWVFARLSMLFPATAIDEHMKLRIGWRFARGQGWRLFWIIAIVAAPFWIVLFPISVVMEVALWDAGWKGSLTANLLYALIFQVFGFAAIAAGVSALSISYKRLRDDSAASAPG